MLTKLPSQRAFILNIPTDQKYRYHCWRRDAASRRSNSFHDANASRRSRRSQASFHQDGAAVPSFAQHSSQSVLGENRAAPVAPRSLRLCGSGFSRVCVVVVSRRVATVRVCTSVCVLGKRPCANPHQRVERDTLYGRHTDNRISCSKYNWCVCVLLVNVDVRVCVNKGR